MSSSAPCCWGTACCTFSCAGSFGFGWPPTAGAAGCPLPADRRSGFELLGEPLIGMPASSPVIGLASPPCPAEGFGRPCRRPGPCWSPAIGFGSPPMGFIGSIGFGSPPAWGRRALPPSGRSCRALGVHAAHAGRASGRRRLPIGCRLRRSPWVSCSPGVGLVLGRGLAGLALGLGLGLVVLAGLAALGLPLLSLPPSLLAMSCVSLARSPCSLAILFGSLLRVLGPGAEVLLVALDFLDGLDRLLESP